MKRITHLNDLILNLVPEAKDTKLMCRRDVLRLVGTVRADSSDDARRIFRFLTMLRDGADTVSVEEDDLILLSRVFEKNPLNLASWVLGQVLMWLEAAELADTEGA